MSGTSFHAALAHDATIGSKLVGTADLGLALDVGSTPQGLRVVHVELLGVAAARAGLARIGAGLGLGLIDVERITRRGGRLVGLVPSLHGLLAIDLAIPGKARWSIQAHVALSWPYEGFDEAYPAFPRAAVLVGARF